MENELKYKNRFRKYYRMKRIITLSIMTYIVFIFALFNLVNRISIFSFEFWVLDLITFSIYTMLLLVINIFVSIIPILLVNTLYIFISSFVLKDRIFKTERYLAQERKYLNNIKVQII